MTTTPTTDPIARAASVSIEPRAAAGVVASVPNAADRIDASGQRGTSFLGDVPDPVPSWDEVATTYGPKIYAMAYRLTGNRHEAEDLAQDVFVRVYRNLDKYSPGTFDGWLYRITKNLFLDRIRRRKRVRMVTLPDDDWHASMQDGPDPSQLLEDRGLTGTIEAAITTLPPTFRTAVVLCDVQGMTYEEIADATGWPLGTVRSRIHRGRRMLRTALAELDPSGSETSVVAADTTGHEHTEA